MRKAAVCWCGLLMLTMLAAQAGFAQQKDKADTKIDADAKAKSDGSSTPVLVRIFLTELDGENKVKHLPYMLYVDADNASELKAGSWTKLRIGSRIPIWVGSSGGMQYIDVGTNIDARASFTPDRRLLVQLSLEHTWVEGDVSVPITKGDSDSGLAGGHFLEPIIRGFKSELYLTLREGQSVDSTTAADPISGKTMKAEVSFAVVK